MLYALSGRQFSGGGCQSTVVLDAPPGQHAGAVVWSGLMPPDSAWWRGGRPRRVGRRPSVVALPDPPVTSVDEVLIDGQAAVEGEDYLVTLPAGQLRRDGCGWPVDGSVAITYSHGIPPPIGGRRSAVFLALELGKAWVGDKRCALPRRSIETIQREGVTISMVNNVTTLDAGKVGLWEIDSWLAEINPQKLSRRAAVVSPDVPRTRRIPR